jgi:hypothetical protein
MGSTVEFIKNYKKGNRAFLKGQIVIVTPWFRDELLKGKFVKVKGKEEKISEQEKEIKPKVHIRNLNN